MTPAIPATHPTPVAGLGLTAAPAATPAASVSKDMFLQLLVAQLRHQDPLNPSESTQFLAQLAQFQQMEQSVNMGQDITAIRQDMDQLVAAPAQTGS